MTEATKSKFWGGSSESEEEDDRRSGDEGLGSEGEEGDDVPSAAAAGDQPARKGGWFVRGAYESSSDDEVEKKRTVRTPAQKVADDFSDALKRIKSHSKSLDAYALISDFDALQKVPQKKLIFKKFEFFTDETNQQTYAKAGTIKEVKPYPPKGYIKAIVALEDFVKQTSESKEEKQKRLAGQKQFTTLKLRLKKIDAAAEKEVAAYRAKPDGMEDDEEEDEVEEEEDERDETAVAFDEEDDEEELGAPKKPVTKGGFDDEEEDEDEEDRADVYRGEDDEGTVSKWKKKEPKAEATVSKKQQKREQKKVTAEEGEPEEGEEGEEKAGEKKEPEQKKEELTQEGISKLMEEYSAQLGKKRTELLKLANQMAELAPLAQSAELKLQILLGMLAARFNASPISAQMPTSLWRLCQSTMAETLALLSANPHMRVVDHPEAVAEAGVFKQAGNLLVMVERLDDEFLSSLKLLDAHKQEYVNRMGDEPTLVALEEAAQAYYERTGDARSAVRMAVLRMEHTYYKQERPGEARAQRVLDGLASLVYEHGSERFKSRAVLFQVYHHAIHGRFHEARDLLLRTHIQEGVGNMDVQTQILYNRTVVQVGLCAFRLGMIAESHSTLSELYAALASPRELLGQGLSTPWGAPPEKKDPHQEAEDRKRQVPYHMHINLELIEAANLVAAMLVEIPAAAAGGAPDAKRRAASKQLRRILDIADRQLFSGPPQSMRDSVVAASRALQAGDWRACADLILAIKSWQLFPNADAVRAFLRRRIQEDGLRTYLLLFSQHFQSISLQALAEKFDLPIQAVRCAVSRMIIGEELHASFDEPTGALVPQHADPNRLQSLALTLADKAAVFVESNERLLDARTGSYGYKFFDQKQDQPSIWAPRSSASTRGRQQGGFQQRGGYRGGRGGFPRSQPDGFQQQQRGRRPPITQHY